MPTIIDNKLKVAVIGLGYVGLPLLCKFWAAGLSVLGLDNNPAKIESLQRGQSPIEDVSHQALQDMLASSRCVLSHQSEILAQADAIFICVPTPLSASREPDLSYILSAVEQLIPHLRTGQLVVLESTTYPGTTEELIVPLIEAAGFVPGVEVALAFSPERIDPGNRHFPVGQIPKVVGGLTPQCTEKACAVYHHVGIATHGVSSPRVAEAAKILENTFRSVNIALVNEFAQICHTLDLNVWEVIEAADTKPFGFMRFNPGPGIGGHCIPLDPHYLMWKTRFQGFEPRFISLADQVNREMPHYIVQRSLDILNDQKKALNGSRVLLVGVAYKPNISDARETPALYLWPLLEGKGAAVFYHDPHVPDFEVPGPTQHVRHQSQPLSPAHLQAAAYDLMIILTPHDSLDYEALAHGTCPVFDTRNILEHKLPELRHHETFQQRVVTL